MSIEKEIERAVKRTIALDKDTPYKSAAEQEKIISDIKSAFNDATFHFENKPEESLFNWKGIKNFADQITYRTYQRTVFKRYRKNTYGLYASLD